MSTRSFCVCGGYVSTRLSCVCGGGYVSTRSSWRGICEFT